jgi:hypothetical protein
MPTLGSEPSLVSMHNIRDVIPTSKVCGVFTDEQGTWYATVSTYVCVVS